MKAKTPIRTSVRLFSSAISVLLASNIYGQTLINLGSQSRNADFTNFPYTRPIKTGTTLPSSCSAGDMFLNTTATNGQNIFICGLTNSWIQQGGLADPGASGLVKRTGPNTTTVISAPASAVVGVSDVQTLTNKSLDASEITSGMLSSARIPALTGDVTTAPNSSLTTLSTVNSTPGTFGDATHSLQLIVDNKGRVTGVTPVVISQSNSGFYQQLSKSGAAVTQRSTLNFSGAFSASDNAAGGRTDVDLASVNSNPGTYGSSTQIPIITVNSYGQITTVSNVAASGGGGGSTTASAGTFASIPASCVTGSLYLASDQPVGQQLYTCSSSNAWTAVLSVGGSGGLAVTGGSLDIVTSVIPRLSAANSFTGLNTFNGGLRLASSTQPSCDSTARGSIYFQNNGSSKDSLTVCVYNGLAYSWVSLY